MLILLQLPVAAAMRIVSFFVGMPKGDYMKTVTPMLLFQPKTDQQQPITIVRTKIIKGRVPSQGGNLE